MKNLSKLTLSSLLAGWLISCSTTAPVVADYQVVPIAQSVTLVEGQPFILDASTKIYIETPSDAQKRNAEFLTSYIDKATGFVPTIVEGSGKGILLVVDSLLKNKEAYRITVTPDKVIVAGASEAGVFYGIQTLRKSFHNAEKGAELALAAVVIEDSPRLPYRGMMLDVSRHMFSMDSLKRYVDILALHNMNTFHIHLTDDQGWRVEIKKYPELTQVGAMRNQTVLGRNSGEYDGKPYGGFYTQEQLKELVAYASDRYINVVPEIDLPGHQLAALTTYPELGCTGGPYEVWGQWGVADDVICAGNEKSMQFLEDVLAEIIEIFPSKYIHVGGDECPKVRWKSCPKCQARINAEGLKADPKHTAEERLQSSVIARMERFVESKGRHIIGWDEILEGGLAPNATVMSWRSLDGGIEAAKQLHNAIMTPTSFAYFDYYQSTDTENEPFAIGGYVPLSKVYSLEPVSEELTEAQKPYIIGVQGNLWTEYIPNFAQVEYMVLPRMAAMAEVGWSRPEQKDYSNFLGRLVSLTALYDAEGYNYAKHIFDVQATLTPNPEKGELIVAFSNLSDKGDIYYTLDGTIPSESSLKYTEPFSVKENIDLCAAILNKGAVGRAFKEQVRFNKATMKPIALTGEPAKGYAFDGAGTLVDGVRGNDNYKTGRWLGFYGNDMDAIIDLQQPTSIEKVAFSTNVVKGDWIVGPAAVVVKVSDDGKSFREVASLPIVSLTAKDRDGVYENEVSFDPIVAQYVEVVVKNGKLPSWHPGNGSNAYIFVDEIAIY